MWGLVVVLLANLQCTEDTNGLHLPPFKRKSALRTQKLTHSHTGSVLTQPHLFFLVAFTDSKWFGAVPSGAPAACASRADTFNRIEGKKGLIKGK